MAFVRGFKARAERLAARVRRDLGISLHDRLDPHALAAHLGIGVMQLPDLLKCGASAASIRHFTVTAPKELSAFMIGEGGARLIVENPNHSTRRRSSTLTHELAHVLLDHQPGPAFGLGGCRRWNQNEEDEADWLAGELLVPRQAALRLARLGTPLDEAAETFGVSLALLRWRMNHSGATLQARREDNARKRMMRGGSRPRSGRT